MCSTGVLLARSFVVVLLCLAAVEIHLTPAMVLGVPTKASLAHCRSHCGGVEISYPFGIGPRCFRRGFELTCDNTTGSPRLLFLGNNSTQVTHIYVGGDYASVSVSALEYNNITMGLGADTYTQSWEAPADGVIQRVNYLFGLIIDDMSTNYLYVIGCGVEVNMFGDNATDLLGFCVSICTDNREIMERANMENGACQGFGCCKIDLSSTATGRQAFTFTLGRYNSTIAQLDKAPSSINVIFSGQYDFSVEDLYASLVNTSNVQDMELDIAITDQPNCASAQSQENKDTYACNSESICYNLSLSRGGYSCYCPGQNEGNPYVADGCIIIPGYKREHKENCTRFCGNMTIPFPFGVEEGCFGNDDLRLKCSSNFTTVLDRGGTQYGVTSLSLDGFLTVTNYNNTQCQSFTRSYEDEDEDDHLDCYREDIMIKWVVASLTCEEAMRNKAAYACISENSLCENVTREETHYGYLCKCSDGFHGNPYLENNCTGCSHGKVYDQKKNKCVMSAKQRNLILGVTIGLACGLGSICFCNVCDSTSW